MKAKHVRRILLGGNILLLALLGATYIEDPYSLLHGDESAGGSQSDDWSPVITADRQPFSEYARAMTGRRLFQYGLRTEKEPTKKNVIEDYQFIGKSQTPNGPRGFLKNSVTNKTRTVMPGDTIGDFEVKEIRSQSIVFQKGMEEYELRR